MERIQNTIRTVDSKLRPVEVWFQAQGPATDIYIYIYIYRAFSRGLANALRIPKPRKVRNNCMRVAH